MLVTSSCAACCRVKLLVFAAKLKNAACWWVSDSVSTSFKDIRSHAAANNISSDATLNPKSIRNATLPHHDITYRDSLNKPGAASRSITGQIQE